MYSSEANLLPANDSVAIKDIYNNNDEIADNNDENLIPDRKNIHDNDIFKNPYKTKLKKRLERKKKNCTNSKTLTTKLLSQ